MGRESIGRIPSYSPYVQDVLGHRSGPSSTVYRPLDCWGLKVDSNVKFVLGRVTFVNPTNLSRPGTILLNSRRTLFSKLESESKE